MNNGSGYPRPLTPREKAWLDWLLPLDRKGYREYRKLLEKLLVIGEGRRGKGNLILGRSGERPDVASPLPPVFAYGVIETIEGPISILAREELEGQVDIEIVPLKGDEIPDSLTEKSRWTYSTWSPGDPCPRCTCKLREVPIGTPTPEAVLAICRADHRLWVYDAAAEVNHLIPLTNFYNELMLHKNIRDPKIALDAQYFYHHLQEFTDEELVHTFIVYNRVRKKVQSVSEVLAHSHKRKPLAEFMKRIFNHSE